METPVLDVSSYRKEYRGKVSLPSLLTDSIERTSSGEASMSRQPRLRSATPPSPGP